MTYAEIDQVLAAMQKYGVTRLEWDHLAKGSRLSLTLADVTAEAPAAVPVAEAVIAPAIGSFVPRGGDDGLSPFTGHDLVRLGETLGYISQGPVLHLLTAPCTGTVSGPFPDIGQVFGFGDTVMHLAGVLE